jgi:hypothetical protein
MSNLYQHYKQDPNFRDLTNRLLEVMEMYRWSTGDHQDQYEEQWHDALAMAETIHDADERHISLDKIPERLKRAAADLGAE